MTGPVLATFLERERVPVDAALERVTRVEGAHQVAEGVRYAVRGGGKRLRPVLVVAGYRAFTTTVPEPVYDLAAALELIHTYSLVHDDLPSMDDDPVRRGRPATHVRYGVAAATVAAAAMIPLSLQVAAVACRRLGLPPARRSQVLLPVFAAAGAGGMVGGQVMDLGAEGRELSVPELEDIHRRKTGALLGVAARLGAAAAGAGAQALDALQRYGAALGLAFQITDDILDVVGTTARLGKTVGRDDVLAKASFAGIEGVERARAHARREVEAAVAALRAGAIRSSELEALAHYAAERDR